MLLHVSYSPVTGQRQTLTVDDPHTFYCDNYFVLGGICTCLGVSSDPMFLWISLNSCPRNLLLVRSHQAEMIIVKSLIQGCNNLTKVQVEPSLCDHDSPRNDAFTLLATLPTLTYDSWRYTHKKAPIFVPSRVWQHCVQFVCFTL